MELKDTIDMMTLDDYKEKFKAEYHQTKIRYEKLKAFCNKIEVAEMLQREMPDHADKVVAPEHDCPLGLLRQQQAHMGMYLNTLEKRAIIENIEL